MTMPTNSGRKRKPSENDLDQQRLINGECLRGCGRLAEDGSSYCAECGPRRQEQQAQSMKRSRASLHAAGLCVDCEKPAPKKRGGFKWRCRACIKLRRERRQAKRRGCDRDEQGVNRDPLIAIDQQRHDRQSRTWNDNEGRVRFHGRMRRGPPTKADSDLADLNDMQDTLNKAKVGYYEAQDPEVLAAPPIQREAWRRRWLAHVAHLGRYCRQLLGHDFDEDLEDPKSAKAAR